MTIERPLRLKSQFTKKAVEGLRFNTGDETIRRGLYAEFGQDLYERFLAIRKDIETLLDGDDSDDEEGEETTAPKLTKRQREKLLDPTTWENDRRTMALARVLHESIGDDVFNDHNAFRTRVDEVLNREGFKATAAQKKTVYSAVSWRDEEAARIIKKVQKKGTEPDPFRGLFEAEVAGKSVVVAYESDTDLRDTEQIPLLEQGGIEAFVRREVLPYVSDAWMDETKTKVGYEISFNRVFYRPPVLRTLAEIRADIEELEAETDGLLSEVLVEAEA